MSYIFKSIYDLAKKLNDIKKIDGSKISGYPVLALRQREDTDLPLEISLID